MQQLPTGNSQFTTVIQTGIMFVSKLRHHVTETDFMTPVGILCITSRVFDRCHKMGILFCWKLKINTRKQHQKKKSQIMFM